MSQKPEGYVTIHELFNKVGDEVYRYWKFEGEDEWRIDLTPYKDKPFIKIEYSREEYLQENDK